MTPRPALFLDRDNTLVVADAYLGDPAGVVLMPGAAELVAGARSLGYAVFTVSNQSGVARGFYTADDVRAVDGRMDALLSQENPAAVIDRHAFCPHHPDFGPGCDCRKPSPGMTLALAAELGLDLARSWTVGDAPRDVVAGRAAGTRTALFSPPGVARSPAADAALAFEPDARVSRLADVLPLLAGTGDERE